MIDAKIDNFLIAPDDAINFGDIGKIKLSDNIYIYWGTEKIGQLSKGSKIYSPVADVFNSKFISSEKKLLVSAKLQNWIDNLITDLLRPIKDKLDNSLNANVRAIAFNCFENLGTLEIDNYREFIRNIDDENKKQLSKLGIRIGAKYFFMPNLMKKKSIELNSLLWKIYNKNQTDEFLPLPKDGRVSFTTNIKMPKSYWQSIGYICINDFAFRVDVFEKIFYLARKKIKSGPFLETPELMNPIGCNSNQLKDILTICGYDVINLPNQRKIYFFKQSKIDSKKKYTKKNTNIKRIKKNKNIKKSDPNSPFAVLEKLL
tara:strand:+ start:51 stop:998 length:948 start_codon:yes stop_codon:yes gene_type:complete